MADSQDCRVYVGNIDWKITRQELKSHMESAGDVVLAEISELLRRPAGPQGGGDS